MRYLTLARRFATIVVTMLVGSACGSVGTPSEGPSDGVWPGDAWSTSTPEAEGLDAASIDSLVADLESGVYGLVDQFLLIRHGHVVADHRFEHDYDSISAQYEPESYQYDYDDPEWHPYYRDTQLHTLQSVTKSVASAALGIAMDNGLIDGVDASVWSFFEAYSPDVSDPRKAAITLEDFLTMRSGIAWAVQGETYDDDSHPTVQLENSETWVQFVVDRGMNAEPGTEFDYNDGVSVLLGKIVREATGQRIDAWAQERLFEPIGIDEFYWKISPDGEVDTEGGLYLTTHDLARIGYLFLRGGEWDGRQVVSAEWVAASTSPVVEDVAPDNGRPDAGYGYQWWVPDHAEGRAEVFAGNGYGGQFLLVSPEHDMVAVFNGWNIHGGDVRSTWRAFQERIVPAVR